MDSIIIIIIIRLIIIIIIIIIITIKTLFNEDASLTIVNLHDLNLKNNYKNKNTRTLQNKILSDISIYTYTL